MTIKEKLNLQKEIEQRNEARWQQGHGVYLKPLFRNVKFLVERGMINTIQAMKIAIDHYQRGTFDYDEAIDALRALLEVRKGE